MSGSFSPCEKYCSFCNNIIQFILILFILMIILFIPLTTLLTLSSSLIILYTNSNELNLKLKLWFWDLNYALYHLKHPPNFIWKIVITLNILHWGLIRIGSCTNLTLNITIWRIVMLYTNSNSNLCYEFKSNSNYPLYKLNFTQIHSHILNWFGYCLSINTYVVLKFWQKSMLSASHDFIIPRTRF